jgi:hypothetical protein
MHPSALSARTHLATPPGLSILAPALEHRRPGCVVRGQPGVMESGCSRNRGPYRVGATPFPGRDRDLVHLVGDRRLGHTRDQRIATGLAIIADFRKSAIIAKHPRAGPSGQLINAPPSSKCTPARYVRALIRLTGNGLKVVSSVEKGIITMTQYRGVLYCYGLCARA